MFTPQNSILWKRFLLFWGVLIPFYTSLAQGSVTIVNQETEEPVPSAHIHFINKTSNESSWGVSNKQGVCSSPFSDSSLVLITHVGYSTIAVEIAPNESKTVRLIPQLFNLGEFVITANFKPLEIKESVQDIHIIKREDMDIKGAENLREVLTNSTNIRTSNTRDNQSALNINGLSGQHVKILIDGVPVEGKLNGAVDLSQINTNSIERIEIIDGPSSVTYGTNALGGVINIITKKDQYNKLSANANLYYESVGQYNADINAGWKKDKNRFSIMLGRRYFDGYSIADTSRFKDWKPREQYQGNFTLNRNMKHLKLTYAVDGFTEKMTSRGPRLAPYYVTAFDTYYYTDRLTNRLLLNGRVGKDHFINLTLSQAYYQRTRNVFFKNLVTLDQFITENDNEQDTTQYQNYLFRGVYQRDKDSSKVSYMIGTELKQDYIIAERVSDYRQNIGDYALFGSVTYKPNKKLTIKPAARYGYHTRYSAPVTPSINWKWDLNKQFTLKGSYAKGFRAPTLKELFLEFHFNSTINVWGNDQLLPESSDHLFISGDYHKKLGDHELRVQPKLFYTVIENIIQTVQITNVDWQYQNIGTYSTHGGQLQLAHRYKALESNFSVNSFGYHNSISGESEKQFNYTTELNGGLKLRLDSLSTTVSVDYKYTGAVASFYLNDEQEVENGFLGDYHTLDASVSKRLFNNQLLIVAGAKNILNVTDVELIGKVYGYTTSKDATSMNVLWGRSYFVSLKLTL